MEIDVNAIHGFFKNYRNAKEMPGIVRKLTMRGDVLTYDGLRTGMVEAKSLDAELLEALGFLSSDASNIPILYLGKGKYIAYDPNSGKRWGDSSKVYSWK
jgi:hypothetical protein